MKVILCLLIILISTNKSYSQKNANSGELISKDVFNASTLSIGSIQQSILTLNQFQSLNGDCWRLMDGSALTGTDLGQLTGMVNLPNTITNGEFLRQSTTAAPVGTIQGDAIRNITGSFSASNIGDAMIGSAGTTTDGAFYKYAIGNGRVWSTSSSNYARVGLGFDSSLTVPTASENRPKNLSVNFFIRVNKQCNFN